MVVTFFKLVGENYEEGKIEHQIMFSTFFQAKISFSMFQKLFFTRGRVFKNRLSDLNYDRILIPYLTWRGSHLMQTNPQAMSLKPSRFDCPGKLHASVQQRAALALVVQTGNYSSQACLEIH